MNVSVLFALDIRQTKRISSARHSIEYVLCLAVLHFSRLSHKQHFVRNKFIEHKTLGLIFSTNLHEAFLILRKIQRYIIINVHIFFTECNRYSCRILFELKYSPLIFEKYLEAKFQENPSSSYMRTDVGGGGGGQG